MPVVGADGARPQRRGEEAHELLLRGHRSLDEPMEDQAAALAHHERDRVAAVQQVDAALLWGCSQSYRGCSQG